MVDGLGGLVVRSLRFTVRTVLRIGPTLKAAVGHGTPQALVKERESQGDRDTLCRELMCVPAAIAFGQDVAIEFAQIAAKLVLPVTRPAC
jgi:hypothetical protein